MTQYTIGQRVRCIRTKEERAEETERVRAMGELWCYTPEEDALNVSNNMNAPIVGDTGTIEELDEDFDIALVNWDRDIGPVSGERTKPSHWYMEYHHFEPLEADQEEAA